MEEHIATRKGWVRYVYLKTEVNRRTVDETDDFIAHVYTRLKEAKRA
jgi:hypothetical protein